MTEGACAFTSTQAERSRLAKQSKYKKNGVGVAKLGNKPLTNKEIASKHGPCVKYDFNRFLTFSEFKGMPKDLQIEYINKLEDKYDIGIKHISIILFNVGEEGLRSHLRINNILKECNPDKKRGKTGEQQFRDDIAEQKRRMKFGEEIKPVFEEKPAVVEAVPDSKIPMFMDYDSFKKLQNQEKIDFCNRLLKEYPGIGLATISTKCFNKSDGTLNYHLRAKKIIDQVHYAPKGSYDKEIVESLERFVRDVDHWKTFGTLTYEPERVEANIPVEKLKTNEELLREVVAAEQMTLDGLNERLFTNKKEKEETVMPVEKEEPVVIKAVEDERIGMSFHSDYISDNGLKEEEFDALKMLFKDKKVRVNIDISAW